jgi:hypothetical protein
MNEAKWLAATEPHDLLLHLESLYWTRTRAGRRKLRLFGCACCRRHWRLLDECGRRWLEMAEEVAAGLRRVPGRKEVVLPFHPGSTSGQADRQAKTAAFYALTGNAKVASNSVAWIGQWVVGSEELQRGDRSGVRYAAEEREQARLVREIAGNPFRPVALPRACRTPVVRQLAQAAYDERQLPGGELDPQRLAVLADALEESGADAALLDHLRGPGPHVRGCFALDTCLGLA